MATAASVPSCADCAQAATPHERNPHANGGLLLRESATCRISVIMQSTCSTRRSNGEFTRVMGKFLRDVMKLSLDERNFRLFSPDENNSNRWQDVLEVTIAPGWRISFHGTIIWRPMDESWRC